MSAEFDRDLEGMRSELDAARQELSGVVAALSDADLERERRGGWTVRRVLEHVIQSEWLYARLVNHLREQPVPDDDVSGAPASVADATHRLEASRGALLAALAGVDEEAFYRLRTLGHEEYSIISVLENVSNHDSEHAEQVKTILAAS